MTTIEQVVRKAEMAGLAEKLAAENEIVIMFTRKKDGMATETIAHGTTEQLLGALGMVFAGILKEFPRKERKALTARMVEYLIFINHLVDEREG